MKLVDIRNKKKEYLEVKIDEFGNSNIKNIRHLYRGINDFKDYQSRTNVVKDENGYLVTNSHGTLFRWRNHFSQLLNVCGVIDFRQTEIHTNH